MDREMFKLHEAYDKHEYQAFASVMSGSDMATLYVCGCGGSLATSRCVMKNSKILLCPVFVFSSRSIIEEWIEPVVQAIAHNKTATEAWLTLPWAIRKTLPALKQNNKKVYEAEIRYGMAKRFGLKYTSRGRYEARPNFTQAPRAVRQMRAEGRVASDGRP